MISLRHFLISLLLFIIVSALVYGFLPKPVSVETTEVLRKALQVVIEEEGKTRLKDRFQISTPVAGTLNRLDWKVGDVVEAGQKIAKIAPLKSILLDSRSRAEAEDRVAAAKASLNVAKSKVTADRASAEYAYSEYERIKQIYDKKLISRSQFDAAETEKRRANANLDSAIFTVKNTSFALNEAKNLLRNFTINEGYTEEELLVIYSPIKGQVLAIYQESEVTVQAGQIIMGMGNAQVLEVEVEVLSADAVRIQPGSFVEFDRWGGEQSLTGQVRIIEPTGFTKISALGVEEQRVRIIVDITSPTELWVRLGDGYRIDTKFILWQGQNILQIPENSLFRNGDGWATFVAGKDNKAALRQVMLGKRNGLYAQVVDGLSEGERVISHPDSQIEEGSKLSL